MPIPDLHHDNPADIANAKTLEIPIQGPGDANRLLIFTGTAIIDLQGKGPDSFAILKLWIPLPAGYGPPVLGLKATTFLAIAAENIKDLDANFQITNVQTVSVQDQQGANFILSSFTITIDEVDYFHRLAYQVCAPLHGDAGTRFGPSAGCDARDFQAHPAVAHDGDSSVQNPSLIECVLPSTAGNAANLFAIYTGTAWTGIYPTDDNIMRRSTATLYLDDIDLLQPSNLLNASASATLSHITNNSRSQDTMVVCAVNCVDIGAQRSGQPTVPAVTSLVAVLGEAANSGVSSISYQANVEMALPLQLLVSASGQPGTFAGSARINGPGYWMFQVILPFPAPPPTGGEVTLMSSDQMVVPNPQNVAVTLGERLLTSSFQTAHNAQRPVDVVVTASFSVLGFGTITATAMLNVAPPPR